MSARGTRRTDSRPRRAGARAALASRFLLPVELVRARSRLRAAAPKGARACAPRLSQAALPPKDACARRSSPPEGAQVRARVRLFSLGRDLNRTACAGLSRFAISDTPRSLGSMGATPTAMAVYIFFALYYFPLSRYRTCC